MNKINSPIPQDVALSTFRSRLLAVVEVIAVFILLRLVLVLWLIPAFGLDTSTWGGRFLVYAVWIAAALLLVLLRRGDPKTYGLGLSDAIPQARMALSLFAPFAATFFLTGFLLPQLLPGAGGRWPRELLGMLVWIALLLWISRLVSRGLAPAGSPGTGAGVRTGVDLPAMVVLPLAGSFAAMTLGERLTGFAFYLFFLGPGEEILYRGYMQSRLNAVFGRPYRLLGAEWGWGLVIATLLFGLMHAFNGFDPARGQYQLDWAWAAGATVAGLVFAYLRERTGSVVAPAILHGLPQAIAALFMRF